MKERWIEPIAPRGIQATCAAGIRARFGYWPADFLDIVHRCYHGRIPRHVEQLREFLERTRPWERCAHGVDLTAPFPFCSECNA